MPTPRFYQEPERLCLLLDAEKDFLKRRAMPILYTYLSVFAYCEPFSAENIYIGIRDYVSDIIS